MKKLHYALLLACTLCVMLVYGCGSSSGSTDEGARVLEFTGISVKAEARNGFLGGRYASFEVTGSVKNNTGNPINADNIPSLSWEGGSAKPKLSQDKLLDRETCNVSWKEEVAINNNSVPELVFSGGVEYSGLDDCQVNLNEQIQKIAAEYAAADAAKEEEKAAREQAKADAAQKREDDKAALNACEGKTAYEAYEVAKNTDFEPGFFDVAGVDVTGDVSDGTDAGKATVVRVDISEAGWFSSDKVSFALDYEDPTTRAKREEREAEEAKQKEAEERVATLEAAFPQETAYRAATVSLTNQIADDVFASDGNSLDPSKFHSYSDRSGFFLEPVSKGTWSYKDELTWHAEDLKYTIAGLGTRVRASCDVHFDGENYIISNQSGLMGNLEKEEWAVHLDEYEKEKSSAPARVVSPDLLV